MLSKTPKPTKENLAAAAGKTLPDVIARDLDVLFCGINPGLYTVAVQQHFGRPGNRFWPVLHRAGFTPRLFHPSEQRELLPLKLGITNLVARATTAAAELSEEELAEGARALEHKVRRYKPRVLAIVGIGAYRTAFARPRASLGLQPERIGDTAIWVLPNPSGLNAHYRPDQLSSCFASCANGSKNVARLVEVEPRIARVEFRGVAVAEVAEEVRLDVAFGEKLLIAAFALLAGAEKLLVEFRVVEA
jgi:TDG/mug DNA glycosylase family protein